MRALFAYEGIWITLFSLALVALTLVKAIKERK